MPKRPPKPTRPSAVREPVQVYLAPEDSTLLASLALESGLAKAEIIRRSVRSYARTMQRESPMMQFLKESLTAKWHGPPITDIDAALAEEYMNTHEKPARRRK